MPDDLLSGIPVAFWNSVPESSRSLLLCGCLCPFAAELVEHLSRASDALVFLSADRELSRSERLRSGDDTTVMASADLQKLPLSDSQFDLVISAWTLHVSSDPKDHVREIWRVLKPGGMLLALDPLNATPAPSQQLGRKALNLMLEIDQATIQKPLTLLSASEIIELLHGCAFADVQARKVNDCSGALPPEELEALREQVVSLLSQRYSQAIVRLPNGPKRWGRRLEMLLADLESARLDVPPYLTVCAARPKSADRDSLSEAAAKPKRKVTELAAGYLAADENARYTLRFRELPDEFKPREKLIMHGPAALKNHELLAVLLVSGTTRENVLELSRRLIQEYGSRAIAQERSVRRLQETLSVGMNKACQIVAAFELGRRFFKEPLKKSPTILAADDAYEYLRDMAKFTKEHFRGLYLNTRNRVIRDEIISIGTLNMSVVHPREVFLPAVEFSAAAVILAHNHPSGDPTPSEEDLAITHQMVEAGKVMGIEVFDHIIIGEDSFVSLQQEGKLR